MRTALIALFLISAPSVARAGETAYYDIAKVATDCAACKSEAQATNADAKPRQAEINKLIDEAKVAETACGKHNIVVSDCRDAAAKRQRAQELFTKHQAQIDKRQSDAFTKTQVRVSKILPELAKARHLAAIIPLGGSFYAAPAVNLTAEIVRRLDAGEGKGDDELRAELAKALAENAKLKAAKPEAAKK